MLVVWVWRRGHCLGKHGCVAYVMLPLRSSPHILSCPRCRVQVLVSYVFNPMMGPHSRVKRDTLKPEQRTAIISSTTAELD